MNATQNAAPLYSWFDPSWACQAQANECRTVAQKWSTCCKSDYRHERAACVEVR